MQNVIIVDSQVLSQIVNTQNEILKIFKKNKNENEKYISRPKAAIMFGCDTQTIRNLENEGRITRYGRDRLIRYSISDLKVAFGIK